MTVHTALDIRPAYEPKSYAEIVAADKERERKWRAAAQKRPVARAAAIERQPERNEPEAPVERIWPHRFGPMTSEFIEWRTNEPLGYLKMRCRELDISYDDIIGQSHKKHIVRHRHDLMVEVYERYGRSLSKTGKLFKRDHSVIHHALTKAGAPREQRERDYEDRSREVVALFNSGFRVKEIAERLNCPQSRVSAILDCHFPNRPKPRKLADYSDAIREAFDTGVSYAEIGRLLEFDPSVISKFIKRMDWKR